MPHSLSLSPAEARKLILLSQGVHKENQLGRGKNAVLKAIKKLGYIQIDTISVVERAHHHTLWTRAPGYQKHHLDALHRDGEIFEYWSHAAAYLPMCDFRYSLPRKEAIRNGEKHWYRVEDKVLREVLARVKMEGPLQSKDFDGREKLKTGWGDFKLAKRALEHLFMRGDLMIAERKGFQKVYDLPERILAPTVDTSMPSSQELLAHLVLKFVAANGLATPVQISYLRKGLHSKVRSVCNQLVEDGKLIQVTVGEQDYLALAGFAALLQQPLSRQKIKILSPFDNLLIQRDRTKTLFNFDYQLECYVTAAKRRYGYFVLPILWGHEFAGRMDAKIDRKTNVLTVHTLFLETKKPTEFLHCWKPALERFCAFNGGTEIAISEIVIL